MTGSELKDERLRRGLLAKDVSRQLNVLPSVYSRWENSQSLPRRVSYAALYAMQILEDRDGH